MNKQNTALHTALKYRKDIDGLRAIAVLAVVAYHLGLSVTMEGFVGVDIFFVISGFLITGVIDKEISSGIFTFSGFYIRRVKRIVPALYMVVFWTLICGSLIMLPSDLLHMAKSAFATILSGSNVYFWFSTNTNYFARSSELYPLLHTWSLGVEEQFYFFWPCLFFLGVKLLRPKMLLLISGGVAAASFAISQIMLHQDLAFSYYMLPSRAGELLVGVITYLLVARPERAILQSFALEGISLGGVLLIFYSLFFMKSGPQFPGVNALLPCLGAAFILYAGAFHRTWVSRTLELPPLVYIGLISYSLYLWHWPVVSFGRYLYSTLSPTAILVSLGLMFGCSMVSYHFFETPCRRLIASDRRVWINYFFAPTSVLLAFSIALIQTEGLSSYIRSNPRYEPIRHRIAEHTKPAFKYDYICQFPKHDSETIEGTKCVVGRPDKTPSVLLWGDSHAAHHVGFLAELANRDGVALRNLSSGSCPPILGLDIDDEHPIDSGACNDLRQKIVDEFEKYDYVLLGGHWRLYDSIDGFETKLRETINYLVASGRAVIILENVPTFPYFDRRCELRNTRFIDVDCTRSGKLKPEMHIELNKLLNRIAEESPHVSTFSMAPYICDSECSPYRNGVPIYFDNTHLSVVGSHDLAKAHLRSLPAIFGSASKR